MIDLNVLYGMKGKRAIVTGGSSGIGLGISRLFAETGMKVMMADRSAARGAEQVKALSGLGGEVVHHCCDVASSASCEAAVKAACELWGGVDVLGNCAGVARRNTAEDLPEADWDLALNVNLKGVYLMCHHVIPVMKRQGGGKIVNMGSGWALKGGDKAVSYCASKGGVWNMTRALAIDCGPFNINVNCVCPGDIDTPMLKSECEQLGGVYDEAYRQSCAQRPIARLGTPRDVAMCVLFLASECAPWVTGSSLVVDGGGIA